MKTLLTFLLLTFTLPFAQADEVTATYEAESRAGSMYWKATVREMRPALSAPYTELHISFSSSYPNPICQDTNVGPSPREVKFIFVVGSERIELPALVSCRGWSFQQTPHDHSFSWYDSRAYVYANTLSRAADFERIFPKNQKGERWFALKLAARVGGEELNDYGRYFPLVLERR